MVHVDASMETEPRPMGSFTLASSAAAAASAPSKQRQQQYPGGDPLSRMGGAPKSKMQKHLQLLRRHGITTQPIQPGVPIAAATSSNANTQQQPWRTLWSAARLSNEDHDVVRELDQDVAGALVAVGGTLMGLPTEELLRSPGMRKLVARNIQWFQGTHDLVKLLGLMAAKKLNQWVQRRYGDEEDRHRSAILDAPTTTTPPTAVFDTAALLQVGVKREREEDSEENLAPTSSTSPPFVFKPLRIKLNLPPRAKRQKMEEENHPHLDTTTVVVNAEESRSVDTETKKTTEIVDMVDIQTKKKTTKGKSGSSSTTTTTSSTSGVDNTAVDAEGW